MAEAPIENGFSASAGYVLVTQATRFHFLKGEIGCVLVFEK